MFWSGARRSGAVEVGGLKELQTARSEPRARFVIPGRADHQSAGRWVVRRRRDAQLIEEASPQKQASLGTLVPQLASIAGERS